MIFEDMGKKVVDIAWEKVKEKRAPRRRLAQAVLRIQESLVRCHEAYLRFKKTPSAQDEYFDAIGQLIRTLFLVKNVLPVLDPNVSAALIDYTGDEVDTYVYPLERVSGKYPRFRDLATKDKDAFKTLALSWGATGTAPEFKTVLAELRRFLKENFTVDEMF
jgi:hypothetical protein